LEQFKILCEAQVVHKSNLVLCAEVSGSIMEHAIGVLEHSVNEHKKEIGVDVDGNKKLGDLTSEALIISTVPPLHTNV
jgi:hypothetical protein